MSWDRTKELIILDELHKMQNWKSWLKGIYDVEGIHPALLVTGSARIDAFRKAGDSLAGRYFLYHLHPFDIKEVKNTMNPDDAFNRIMKLSGFPEPFLANDQAYYNRWKRTHTDIILRQDLLDLFSTRDILSIETLIELLKKRVGTPVSYASLGRDLEKDAKTIKRWLSILELLYVIFPIRPYHQNIGRSLLKSPKYYFFDTAQLPDDTGCKIENITACALLKEVDFLRDTAGMDIDLHYMRSKDGKEIDFMVHSDKHFVLIEVKAGKESLSKNFAYFDKYLPRCSKIQLVHKLSREKTFPDNTEVRSLVPWLADLNLKRCF